MTGWYLLGMARAPVRAGHVIHAHIGGSSTVVGRVRKVWRGVLVLEDASMVVAGEPQRIDGDYLVPIETPMQVLEGGPRPASGVAATSEPLPVSARLGRVR